jgi:hypothetical protein
MILLFNERLYTVDSVVGGKCHECNNINIIHKDYLSKFQPDLYLTEILEVPTNDVCPNCDTNWSHGCWALKEDIHTGYYTIYNHSEPIKIEDFSKKDIDVIANLME